MIKIQCTTSGCSECIIFKWVKQHGVNPNESTCPLWLDRDDMQAPIHKNYIITITKQEVKKIRL
jgi:hypothetical protein